MDLASAGGAKGSGDRAASGASGGAAPAHSSRASRVSHGAVHSLMMALGLNTAGAQGYSSADNQTAQLLFCCCCLVINILAWTVLVDGAAAALQRSLSDCCWG